MQAWFHLNHLTVVCSKYAQAVVFPCRFKTFKEGETELAPFSCYE